MSYIILGRYHPYMRSLFLIVALFTGWAHIGNAHAQSDLGGESVPGPASLLGSEEQIDSGRIDQAIAIVGNSRLSARILGGGEAETGEYPSMVALVNPGIAALERRFFCGATVVAERWVMTAAHCLFDNFGQLLNPEFVRAVAGINDLRLDTPDAEHRVLRIVVHPDYDRTRDLPPNDIALLELESDIGAPGVTLFAGDTEDYANSLGYIAGWGAIEFESLATAVYPTALQDAVVPLVANDVCNAPQSYDGLIEDEHLCAGFVDGEIDACAGDSGGPLFIYADGEQRQAGIVSFGIGCGLPLFYGIYTDVSHYIPWLSQYVDVPFQSPELVAQRAQPERTAVVSNSDDGAFFGGASGRYGLSVLLLWVLIRVSRRAVPSSGTAIKT